MTIQGSDTNVCVTLSGPSVSPWELASWANDLHCGANTDLSPLGTRAFLSPHQVILESMVSLTQELCPVAMRVAEGHNKMLSNVAERVTVPRNFIRGALLEQAGQDIQNKLE